MCLTWKFLKDKSQLVSCPFACARSYICTAYLSPLFHTSEQYLLNSITCQGLKLFMFLKNCSAKQKSFLHEWRNKGLLDLDGGSSWYNFVITDLPRLGNCLPPDDGAMSEECI